MIIFNSVGSNYRPKHLIKVLTGFRPGGKKQLSRYLGDRYAANIQLTYKGREALYLALKKLDLEAGTKVAINGYTCFAVYDSVTAAELSPVYVDVAKNQLNYGMDELKKAYRQNPDIKVVIIQNTLGFPQDVEQIEQFCKVNKLHLIEDLAHSIGMKYADGREAGTVSDAALSFSQDKVVDAVSGGALIYRTKQEDFELNKLGVGRLIKDYLYIFNTLVIRSSYAFGGKFYHYIVRKFKLLPMPMDGSARDVKLPNNWHANLALAQFKDLDIVINHRRRMADIYRSEIDQKYQYQHMDGATYLRFPLKVKDRSALIKELKKSGIHISDTWYDAPVSPKWALDKTNYQPGSCPLSESCASSMLNLPTHVNIDVDKAYFIARKVNQWLSKQEK